jgi:hypothetical protein
VELIRPQKRVNAIGLEGTCTEVCTKICQLPGVVLNGGGGGDPISVQQYSYLIVKLSWGLESLRRLRVECVKASGSVCHVMHVNGRTDGTRDSGAR